MKALANSHFEHVETTLRQKFREVSTLHTRPSELRSHGAFVWTCALAGLGAAAAALRAGIARSRRPQAAAGMGAELMPAVKVSA